MKRFVMPLHTLMLSSLATVGALHAQTIPDLVFDPTWPKELPTLWTLGGITGLALDADENVWVYHRRTI
jgi:hypothetical protein